MKWQPIASAPKDGSTILLCEGTRAFQGFWYADNGYWVPSAWGDYASLEESATNPTHWMPLPEAPE